jgi:hypothetical protein
MAALLNNMASIMDSMRDPKRKRPLAPTAIPGTPGYKAPLARPRGTLLTGADTPVLPRKTLLGS